jgi:hypothetical protein
MGLNFRRRANTKDQATKRLMKSGVYRLSNDREEQDKPKRSWLLSSSWDDPFNYWSAVKYGSILMFLLWWIPIFGPMIAGYVAGRRAGSPIKGVFAVSIPLAIVFFVATMVTIKIIPTVWFGVDLAPEAIFSELGKAVPVFEPLASFTTGYLQTFIGTIQGTSGVRLDFFILAIAFAYIGGIMAIQSLREMQYVVKHGGARCTNEHAGTAKSKSKKGFWPFGRRHSKGNKKKVVDREEDDELPIRAPSAHFNDMKESSGAGRKFSSSHVAHSRTLKKAIDEEDEEEEDDDELPKIHRQKEFERNLNRAKHEAPMRASHASHKKLDTSKKSESDDFRFV